MSYIHVFTGNRMTLQKQGRKYKLTTHTIKERIIKSIFISGKTKRIYLNVSKNFEKMTIIHPILSTGGSIEFGEKDVA